MVLAVSGQLQHMGSLLHNVVSFLVAQRLPSCGMWVSEGIGSGVASCRPSCSTAHGILVTQTGIRHVSPALQGGLSTTGPLGKSPKVL